LPRELRLRDIVLLPAGRVALLGPSFALVLVPGQPPVRHRYSYAQAFAVGSSGLLYTAARHGRVDAFPLAVPAEAQTVRRTEHDAQAALSLAPGGDLVIAIGGGRRSGRRARLERTGPTGELRFGLELEPRAFGRSVQGPVVAPDGAVYLGFPGFELLACDASGEIVFEQTCSGEPAALAGEQAEYLVLREERSLRILDRVSGTERACWGSSFFGTTPKVDARGWIYTRRGDDLVAWDPATPGRATVTALQVGTRSWEFVFAGEGRAFAFPRVGATNELVVVE
jgi:hypothetical protein